MHKILMNCSNYKTDDLVKKFEKDGATIVISASNEPEVLAFNSLRDRFSASAAISGSDLFLRGMRYLYCIGSPD